MRPESGIARVDSRARAFDHDRLGDARQLQGHGSLNGGARADGDVLFVQGRKSVELDVEDIRAGRQRRKAQLPFLVGDRGDRAADQRRRARAHDRAGEGRPLIVADRSDQGSGQPWAAMSRDRSAKAAASSNRLNVPPAARSFQVHMCRKGYLFRGDGRTGRWPRGVRISVRQAGISGDFQDLCRFFETGPVRE